MQLKYFLDIEMLQLQDFFIKFCKSEFRPNTNWYEFL